MVALANQQLLSIPAHKLNVYGGAVSMGHPLGASGYVIMSFNLRLTPSSARIVSNLANILNQEDGKFGVSESVFTWFILRI